MIEFKEYLSKKKALIEDYIRKILSNYISPSEVLQKAIKYSFITGGKRFRPILCLATAEAVGGKEKIILPCACAIEFIHNYSLIHDDLPCMDNDDYRRGYLTCHRKFNEAIALLTGDGLLTLAFEILTHSASSSHINTMTLLRVIEEIASAAGIRGMVGGQALDLSSPQETVEGIEYLHKMKTGSLICVSVRTGALLSEASQEEVTMLTSYAEKLGIAFQIMDDVLDKEEDEKINSFLLVYTPEEAKKKVCEITELAVKYLEPLGKRAERLRQIAWYLCERSY
ncbi:MAG TPA: polyprenyl synthetase family protein [Candidatus Eremiobacteraeota bacterium]|nr:MAG: Farnesyl diphosphate synthase [bacterium ADurb.Bin363]HPZ06987.1 polyprenyl synthetase family protein [Candidatus Eremiobacteraeota bacterium]